MKPNRLKQIESLYHAVLDLKQNERQAFLDKARKHDPQLVSEVQSLLVFEDESEEFIEETAVEVAAKSLSKERKQNLIGEKIGVYRIVSLLGTGGMGEVYGAVDERLGRKVALKLLSPIRLEGEQSLHRFKHEAQTVSALNHPNILTIYEIDTIADICFIATEFIEDKTLRGRISDKDLTSAEILKIAGQTAEALAAAHNAGIVHRDIKPENIMIRSDGYVKVLDFGLAKTVRQIDGQNDEKLSSITQPGLLVGTPNYMSPEQIRGQKIDGRSDIFSLGIVIYEMISGQRPFTGDSAQDTLAATLLEEPKPFAEPPSPEQEQIIKKALEKKAEDRYQTMGELIADLQNLSGQILLKNLHGNIDSTSGNSIPVKSRRTTIISNKKAVLAFSTLLLLAAAMVLFYKVFNIRPTEIDSVAVMPFVNGGGNSDSEYLSEGLTESVINRLSSFTNFKVMSFNSVTRYKNKEYDAKTVGRELSVKAILISRMVQRGEDVSVNTELVSTVDDSRIFGYQYYGKIADILGMREAISKEISERLNLKLSGSEKNRVSRRDTDNAEAYQLYLKGRYFWNKRTAESLRQAIEFFNQAIEKDATYALAYAGLADCYSLISNYTNIPPKESMPMAKSDALKSLEIDENLAEAHASLGIVKKDFDWDFAGAENEFKRAIELNPNYATANQWRAENLVVLNRFDEAVISMKRAKELDPLSLVISTKIGWAYYQARNYDEAIRLLQKTVEIDPSFARTYFFLGRTYQQKKMPPEAINSATKAVELSKGLSLFKASQANIYATSGQTDDAATILRELEGKAKTEYVSPTLFAVIYAGMNDKETSLQWLEKAFEERDAILFNYIRDPQLDNLRNEPRFVDILRRVNLP